MQPWAFRKSGPLLLVPLAGLAVGRQRVSPSVGTGGHVAMLRIPPLVSLPAPLFLSFPIGSVTAKRPSRCELAEFVSYHVLCYKHRNVLPPVMDSDRESNHVRDNHRPPGPGPDWSPTVHGPSCLNLTKKMVVDKRAFLDRAWHRDVSPYLRRFLRRTIIMEVLLLRRVLCPFVGTPHGVTG